MEFQYELDVPATVKDAAENVLAISCASSPDEALVFGQILQLRCLTAASKAAFLKSIGWDAEESTSPVVVVEYEAWVLPTNFAPKNPEHLIYRRERVFVDADTLINDELLTYGLGPEYNYLEWIQIEDRYGPIECVNFPQAKLELLADAINTHHSDQIIEFFKEGGEVPEHLSNPVLKAYDGLAEAAKSQIESEEQEYETWKTTETERENENKLPFSELKFEIDSIDVLEQNGPSQSDSIKRPVLVAPSTHKSRLLYIFASPLPGVEGGWSIEACIVRKSKAGTNFYAEQAKETFNVASATSLEEVKRAIIDQIKDGSLSRLFIKST